MSKKIALVLGSGGARGLAHIGVIEELESRGLEISAVAGTSIGAVIGGLYAAGKLDEFKDWICNLDKRGVLNLMDWTFSAQGFIKGDRVFNEIRKMTGEPKIEDLKIPFYAVSVDINSKKEVHFSKGDLFTAMRASVAIPSVLTPLVYNQMILVDGGVMNPIPTDLLYGREGETVLAVDINSRIPYQKPEVNRERESQKKKAQSIWNASFQLNLQEWLLSAAKSEGGGEKPNYFKIINHSFDLMQDKLASVSLDKYPPDVLVEISRYSADTFDFYKAEELIETGRIAAQKALDKVKNKI